MVNLSRKRGGYYRRQHHTSGAHWLESINTNQPALRTHPKNNASPFHNHCIAFDRCLQKPNP